MDRIPRYTQPVTRCLAIILSAAFCLLPVPAATSPDLPDQLAGWKAAGPQELFSGEDLFLYINGGAELYHEYGFEHVTVRDYSRGEQRLAVEIYAMAGTAFGIFTATRSCRSEQVSLGDGGRLAEYYLRFWSGRHMVVVTAQTGFDGAGEAALEVGTELQPVFPARGELPDLAAALPDKHRTTCSVGYVEGRLGFRKMSPQLAGRLTGFVEAASARYDLPGGVSGQMVIARWPDEASAVSAIERAGEGRVGENKFGLARRGQTILAVVSGGGRSSVRQLLQYGLSGEVKDEQEK